MNNNKNQGNFAKNLISNCDDKISGQFRGEYCGE